MDVAVYQDVRAYRKDPNDTSHIGFIVTFECGHEQRVTPSSYRQLSTFGQCESCGKVARAAVDAERRAPRKG